MKNIQLFLEYSKIQDKIDFLEDICVELEDRGLKVEIVKTYEKRFTRNPYAKDYNKVEIVVKISDPTSIFSEDVDDSEKHLYNSTVIKRFLNHLEKIGLYYRSLRGGIQSIRICFDAYGKNYTVPDKFITPYKDPILESKNICNTELTEEMIQEIIYFDAYTNYDTKSRKLTDKISSFEMIFVDKLGLDGVEDMYITSQEDYKKVQSIINNIYKICINDKVLSEKAIYLYGEVTNCMSGFPKFYELEDVLLEFIDSEYDIEFAFRNDIKKMDIFISRGLAPGIGPSFSDVDELSDDEVYKSFKRIKNSILPRLEKMYNLQIEMEIISKKIIMHLNKYDN